MKTVLYIDYNQACYFVSAKTLCACYYLYSLRILYTFSNTLSIPKMTQSCLFVHFFLFYCVLFSLLPVFVLSCAAFSWTQSWSTLGVTNKRRHIKPGSSDIVNNAPSVSLACLWLFNTTKAKQRKHNP